MLRDPEAFPETDAEPCLPPANLLAGVRVLDLTNVLSGPFATYQLALLGADVIKIENPQGGDLARQLGASAELNGELMGASFIAQNAGKRSIALDLKTDAGREVFLELVATADVVVENFRPKVMTRLGLGYDTLKQHNPRLVYCAISGFGQDGPLRDNPAYDQIIQGMSGIMAVTGSPEVNPLRTGFPVCDTLGGFVAAYSIAASLFSTQKTGKGQFIDVSMLDSSLVALGWVVSNFLSAGQLAEPIGNENMTAAPSGTFETASGPLNIAANKQDHFERLMHIVGRADLISDPRFAGREARKQNRAELNQLLNVALQTRPAQEWVDLLNAAGVPSGCVLTVPEVLDHPQVRERRLVQEFRETMPGGQPYRVVRTGFRLQGTEPGARRPPPRIDEHREEILRELASGQRIQASVAADRPISAQDDSLVDSN